MNLLTKENITIADIQSLIDNGIGESLNLEYKGAGALKKDDTAKGKITKSVSAFANSNGGVLIYGIHEEEQQPKYISYIDGNIFTNEWLEQTIGNIHRKVKVEIIPVRLNDDLSKTVYVVRIPESTDAPHMANDGKYYRRMNFQVVIMEEYEVRNLYYRKDAAELSIADTFIAVYDKQRSINFGKHCFLINLSVANKSKVVEKEYKLTVSIEGADDVEVSWENNLKYIYTHTTTPSVSTTEMVPIFPTEELCIMNLTLLLSPNTIENYLQNANLIQTLHYSSGTKEFKMTFYHMFRQTLFDNNIITEDNKLIPGSLKQPGYTY